MATIAATRSEVRRAQLRPVHAASRHLFLAINFGVIAVYAATRLI